MAKFCKHDIYQSPRGNEFNSKSSYRDTYNALVDPNSLASRRVRWDGVNAMVENEIRESDAEGAWTPMMMIGEED